MRKALVIISVSSRVEALNELLGTIEQYAPDWDVCLLFQDNAGNRAKIDMRRITHVFFEDKMLGCNRARIRLLKAIKPFGYDIYCNLDDDILLTEHTHYEPAITKCLERGTGFVLTNWARTEALMLAKVPAMRDVFVKQALIYQGGGMLYNDIVADIVRALPEDDTVFDEGWPLSAYLAGYTNYRYLGSLAIYKICTSGGMREYFAQSDLSKLKTSFPQYIRYEKSDRGCGWLIPMDANLTSMAKKTHEVNLK